jgi:3-deoxy-7-phosphoheptulonate synthase
LKKQMIYSFNSEDEGYRELVGLLTEKALDFEVIRHDKIVIRVFGVVNDSLRRTLDETAQKPGRLTLRRGTDEPRDPTDKQAMVIAGPCAIESADQLDQIAAFLSSRGIRYLRGGAFKPRTQSESFQGLGRHGLSLLAEVTARYGMKGVTEVMDRSQLDDVARTADILQVGSRNMYNYALLTALGSVDKPVLLKRGIAATIDEWLFAAEYVRRGGNDKVILCERGIRTFEPRTRYTLDLLAIPLAQKLSGLPVIADVSHAAGERALVAPLMRAALAAGADGIMVEVHQCPEKALSDSRQSLSFEEFDAAVRQAREVGLRLPRRLNLKSDISADNDL